MTTRSNLTQLHAERRERLSPIGQTFPTDYAGGEATVTAVLGRYVQTTSGLLWELRNGRLTTPQENKRQ